MNSSDHPPGWEPRYLRGAVEAAHWSREWVAEMPPESRAWEGLTDEARNHWVAEVDAAVEALRHVRSFLIRRERLVCWGCGLPFAGVSNAKYHSAACKQRAYRQRKRDGRSPTLP